jgi:hypothetical protein
MKAKRAKDFVKLCYQRAHRKINIMITGVALKLSKLCAQQRSLVSL